MVNQVFLLLSGTGNTNGLLFFSSSARKDHQDSFLKGRRSWLRALSPPLDVADSPFPSGKTFSFQASFFFPAKKRSFFASAKRTFWSPNRFPSSLRQARHFGRRSGHRLFFQVVDLSPFFFPLFLVRAHPLVLSRVYASCFFPPRLFKMACFLPPRQQRRKPSLHRIGRPRSPLLSPFLWAFPPPSFLGTSGRGRAVQVPPPPSLSILTCSLDVIEKRVAPSAGLLCIPRKVSSPPFFFSPPQCPFEWTQWQVLFFFSSTMGRPDHLPLKKLEGPFSRSHPTFRAGAPPTNKEPEVSPHSRGNTVLNDSGRLFLPPFP